MTNIYKISSSDIIDVRNFYHQASEQVWYVLNEKRIRNKVILPLSMIDIDLTVNWF